MGLRVTTMRSSCRPVAAVIALALCAVAFTETAEAAFPGVNGSIASSSGERAGLIYAVDAEGRNETLVTPGRAIQPAYSADGARIVFASDRDRKSNGGLSSLDIYSMDADGAALTRLTRTPPGTGNNGDESDPAFSPDGSNVVFTTDRDEQGFNPGSPSSEIYVMNADGSDQVRLTSSPGFDGQASFSPDGTKIVFASNRTGANEIYAMDPNGANQTQLTNLPGSANPVFSPDGTEIAFQNADGIWMMNADGSNPTLRHPAPSAQDQLQDWAPDGSRLLLARLGRCSKDDCSFSLWTIAASGDPTPTRLTRPGAINDAAWQPAAAVAPDPPLSLEIQVSQDRRGKYIAELACSNECDLRLTSKGKAGDVRLGSRERLHLIGNQPERLTLLTNADERRIAGERGKLTVSAKAIDDFDQRDRARDEVRLR